MEDDLLEPRSKARPQGSEVLKRGGKAERSTGSKEWSRALVDRCMKEAMVHKWVVEQIREKPKKVVGQKSFRRSSNAEQEKECPIGQLSKSKEG